MTQRYSKYKDSGIDWIGEIPEHWGLNRLKQFGFIYAGLNGKKGDDFSKEFFNGAHEFVPFTTICNYSQIKEENFQYVKVATNEFQNKVLKNDLLFLMSSETLEDIAKSSVYLLDKNAFLNSFCKGFRIKSNKLNPIYINYLLNCSTYRKYFELCGRGFTRINIKQEYVCNTLITIPPIPEQETIAQFLDEKCARIDEAVRIKEKQIDLLKEYRQIAIHQAVTKGLNDQVKMKDSGIDWIGEIPEHWEVKKLKQIGTIKSGEAITNSVITDLGQYEVFGGNGFMGYYYKHNITGKKIIIGRVGALCGNVRLTNEKKWITDNALILDLISENLYRYVIFLLESANLNKLNTSNAQPLITGTKVLNFQITFPPLSEQTQIAAHIESLTAKTDEAIRLKEQQIEQLKQYKTSLINDVVTGKVRVA